MIYYITHHYSGHSDILANFKDLEEAKQEFEKLVKNWELSPSDQFLELWNDECDECETVMEHTFNEGNWETED